MNRRFFQIFLTASVLVSCRAPLSIATVQPQKNISIAANLAEDKQMAEVIEPYKKKMEGMMNTKISYTPVELTKAGNNSSLGSLLADFTFQGAREWAKQHGLPEPDAAVINVGGIRSTIPAGDILTKNIYEVMPFENEVIIVKMKGEDLRGLFDYYLKTQMNNPVSHLYIETENGTITKEMINGQVAEPGKTYYVVTSDYLALGGDNMSFFSKGEMISTGIKLRDLFLQKFQENPTITAPEDIRLNFKK